MNTMNTINTITTGKSPLKFRHELKTPINSHDDLILTNRLRKLFTHDKNSDSDGIYRVNSLYFDTPCDKALRQKIEGLNRREKFRIRYYNDNLSFIRLEKKMKINGLCAKQSAPLTQQEVDMIIDGNIDFLLQSKNPLLIELYSKMRGQLLVPKTIVSYDREAFYYEPGNVRITLDRNLHTGLRNIDFLNTQKSLTGVSDSISILEVKYDNFLPEIVRLAVQLENRQTCAYSKYAVCRHYD